MKQIKRFQNWILAFDFSFCTEKLTQIYYVKLHDKNKMYL